jgi:hypothetical protein
VTRVLADHPHHTLATDDFALLTDLLDARTHFHDDCSLIRGPSGLLDDLAPIGVVTGGLHGDSVTDEQADDGMSKLRGNSSQDGSPILKTHSKERLGPYFDDHAADSTFAFRYDSSKLLADSTARVPFIEVLSMPKQPKPTWGSAFESGAFATDPGRRAAAQLPLLGLRRHRCA